MDRPIYSFEFVQSGKNMIVDACVPLEIGHEIFRLVAAAAKADRAPIATKRPTLKLTRPPEMVLRSLDIPGASRATKSAPKVGRRKPKTAA
jgi:hypothetical protein